MFTKCKGCVFAEVQFRVQSGFGEEDGRVGRRRELAGRWDSDWRFIGRRARCDQS